MGLVTATHEVANGSTDLVNVAQCALTSIRDAGYTPQPDDKTTRFTGLGITRWQTMLYAVNELPDWHFPDDVLCVGWLIECGGPSMGRGPARAQFEDRVKHYVGGTRNRYNRGTSGHGGDGFPESREYSLEQCPHARSRPEPSDDSAPSASSLPPRTSTSTPSPATSTEESHEGETPTLGDYPKPAAKSTSTPSPATSTYTAPVSDEERKAYTPPKSRPPMDFKVFFSSFPVGLVAWLNLYTGWDVMYSGGAGLGLGVVNFLVRGCSRSWSLCGGRGGLVWRPGLDWHLLEC